MPSKLPCYSNLRAFIVDKYQNCKYAATGPSPGALFAQGKLTTSIPASMAHMSPRYDRASIVRKPCDVRPLLDTDAATIISSGAPSNASRGEKKSGKTQGNSLDDLWADPVVDGKHPSNQAPVMIAARKSDDAQSTAPTSAVKAHTDLIDVGIDDVLSNIPPHDLRQAKLTAGQNCLNVLEECPASIGENCTVSPLRFNVGFQQPLFQRPCEGKSPTANVLDHLSGDAWSAPANAAPSVGQKDAVEKPLHLPENSSHQAAHVSANSQSLNKSLQDAITRNLELLRSKGRAS